MQGESNELEKFEGSEEQKSESIRGQGFEMPQVSLATVEDNLRLQHSHPSCNANLSSVANDSYHDREAAFLNVVA
jgi:hypothetical protein